MAYFNYKRKLKCNKCDNVQIYNNGKALPLGVEHIILSSCIYCNGFMKVNYFLGYKMKETNLEIK